MYYFYCNFDFYRCKRWVLASRRQDLLEKSSDYLNKNCRLCAGHFADDQFMNFRRNSLVWNAIPTKFSTCCTSKSKRKPPKCRLLPNKLEYCPRTCTTETKPQQVRLTYVGNSDR